MGKNDLEQAIEDGDIAWVRGLISNGYSPNDGCGPGRWPPVLVAIDCGNTEVLRYLLMDAKADPNIALDSGATGTWYACQENQSGCLGILFEAGADLTIPSKSGSTPLYIACHNNSMDCLRYLMMYGAGSIIDQPNKAGTTPLMIAAQRNKKEAVEFLIKHGADVNCVTKSDGVPAIYDSFGDKEILKTLIDAGADVNFRDHGGFSPICKASKSNCVLEVKELLKAGADPTAAGWNGNTAFHVAAWKGRDHIIAILLGLDGSQKIDINQANYYGYTPLHLAAFGGNHSVVYTLLQEGADVQRQNCRGDTALHCAIAGGNEACIEYLSNASNVDFTLTNFLGMNASDLYRTMYPNGNREILSQNVTDFEPVIPAAKFVDVAKIVVKKAALRNVKLIRKTDYLNAGEMPHFDTCKDNGWHCTAEDVGPRDKVLFISHRWGSLELPDPTGEQYQIAVDFLKSKGEDIEFIWADYSCICQDKGSDEFWTHLANIPTAVWTATHVLIIPKLDKTRCREKNVELPTTNLNDYLGRSWCMLEAMAGMLTGTKCYLAFRLGQLISHEEFDRPEGSQSNFGFFQAQNNVYNRLNSQEHRDFMNIDDQTLKQRWVCVEPCCILALLLKISRSEDPQVQAMLQKSLHLKLTLEDLKVAAPEIKELWDIMGECSFPEDKMVVMNLMLFIGFCSMNLANPEFKETLEALPNLAEQQEGMHVDSGLESTEEIPMEALEDGDPEDCVCDFVCSMM